jgi:hypothetical protein
MASEAAVAAQASTASVTTTVGFGGAGTAGGSAATGTAIDMLVPSLTGRVTPPAPPSRARRPGGAATSGVEDRSASLPAPGRSVRT